MDNKAKLWDIESGKEVCTLEVSAKPDFPGALLAVGFIWTEITFQGSHSGAYIGRVQH